MKQSKHPYWISSARSPQLDYRIFMLGLVLMIVIISSIIIQITALICYYSLQIPNLRNITFNNLLHPTLFNMVIIFCLLYNYYY